MFLSDLVKALKRLWQGDILQYGIYGQYLSWTGGNYLKILSNGYISSEILFRAQGSVLFMFCTNTYIGPQTRSVIQSNTTVGDGVPQVDYLRCQTNGREMQKLKKKEALLRANRVQDNPMFDITMFNCNIKMFAPYPMNFHQWKCKTNSA